jgi:hypothetical protein
MMYTEDGSGAQKKSIVDSRQDGVGSKESDAAEEKKEPADALSKKVVDTLPPDDTSTAK